MRSVPTTIGKFVLAAVVGNVTQNWGSGDGTAIWIVVWPALVMGAFSVAYGAGIDGLRQATPATNFGVTPSASVSQATDGRRNTGQPAFAFAAPLSTSS